MSPTAPTPRAAARTVLDEPVWRAAEAAHHARADALLAGRLARAARRESHAVEDFLFTYYSLRPAQLRRWHPGAGVVLAGAAGGGREGWREHAVVPTDAGPGVTLDVPAYLARRGESVRYVRDLLAATASRPAHLACFGLHEWAMVYRLAADERARHPLPLRLGAAGTDAVVEDARIRCTHFDAFRFFTEPARPRNTVTPTREGQVDLEQPGCLHATMDLYKWAYKLLPAVPSELVADAFELARDVRGLDMRASPYDLAGYGLAPVPVETADGRARYVEEQRGFAERGAILRTRLLAAVDALLAP